MKTRADSHPHMELTEQIIGAAMAVHRALRPGLSESIYKNALCLELTHRGLQFSQQSRFPVSYRGKIVGTLITDLIAEEKVIIECKVADRINEAHIAQTLSYLSITELKVGLVLNFKPASLTFKRIANIYRKDESVKSV